MSGQCSCHGGHNSDWGYGYGRDYAQTSQWSHGNARQYQDQYPRYTRYQRDYHASSHSKPGNPVYGWRNHAGIPNISTRSDFFFIGGSDI